MRSLLKAFLLAPAIVSAFVLPPTSEQDVDVEFEKNDVDATGKLISDSLPTSIQTNFYF